MFLFFLLLNLLMAHAATVQMEEVKNKFKSRKKDEQNLN